MKKEKNAVSWDFISTPTYDSLYTFNDLVIDQEYLFSVATHSIVGKSAAAEIAYTHIGKYFTFICNNFILYCEISFIINLIFQNINNGRFLGGPECSYNLFFGSPT